MDFVRYCPECGCIGNVPVGAIDCCPGGNNAVRVPRVVAEQARKGFTVALIQDDKVYCVAEEVVNGAGANVIMYSHHEQPVPMADNFVLYTRPQAASVPVAYMATGDKGPDRPPIGIFVKEKGEADQLAATNYWKITPLYTFPQHTLSVLDKICDAFKIGRLVRAESTILENVNNAVRRAQCLSAIEREFFSTVYKDEEGEEVEDCALNWGDEPGKYVKRFGGALQMLIEQQKHAAIVPKGLIEALKHQRQIDEDGVECGVSRQAVDEAIAILESLHDASSSQQAASALDGDSTQNDYTDAVDLVAYQLTGDDGEDDGLTVLQRLASRLGEKTVYQLMEQVELGASVPTISRSACIKCAASNSVDATACERCGGTWLSSVPVTAKREHAPAGVSDDSLQAWADGWNAGASAVNSAKTQQAASDAPCVKVTPELANELARRTMCEYCGSDRLGWHTPGCRGLTTTTGLLADAPEHQQAASVPFAWAREWDGDVSDLDKYVVVFNEDERDGEPGWFELYTKPQPHVEVEIRYGCSKHGQQLRNCSERIRNQRAEINRLRSKIGATPDAMQACCCHACTNERRDAALLEHWPRMILCPKCGNKRCPHANDHRNTCTGSNEPGQPGSAYPNTEPPK